MRPKHAITFDIDWAPDWAIADCGALCRSRGIPATFFATHASPILRALGRDPLFEIGIHPNFLPDSSHGKTFAEVMEFGLALVPEARAMRAHDLFTCSSLFELVVRRYRQIRTDSSLFLPDGRCDPFVVHHGHPAGRLVRVPFSFADNVAARTPGWRWDSEPKHAGGPMVFDFHPAHIALNLGAPGAYAQLKAATAGRPLHTASREDFAPLVNAGPGARTYLQRLLERLTPHDCATISTFAAAYCGTIEGEQG
jgi:hypothetical protein